MPPGAVANFYKTNTATRTITLDGSKTVGTLSFNSANSYSISPGTGGSLSLNNSGLGVNVTVPLGTHSIDVPVVAADSVTFNVAGTLSLTAGMSSNTVQHIVNTGAGTLNISGTLALATGSGFSANAGVTNFNSSGGAGLSVSVTAATVHFNTPQNIAALTINTGGKATAAGAINTNTLAITGGQLDLTNNALVVRAGALGSLVGGNHGGVTGLVQTGRNGGAWNGNGIITTQSAAHGADALMTIAVARASDALGLTGGQTKVWQGQTVNGSAVLAMYTYAGDANLSGRIDADDYFEIDSNLGQAQLSTSYFHGDFNYDGKINGDDYFIIDANFAAQSASLAAPAQTESIPVPEPLCAAAICAIVPLLRRRKSRSG